jgi:hypothetical protein
MMHNPSGRFFHIDFGHFLGHAKSKGGFVRDREPFIYSNELNYFLLHFGELLVREKVLTKEEKKERDDQVARLKEKDSDALKESGNFLMPPREVSEVQVKISAVEGQVLNMNLQKASSMESSYGLLKKYGTSKVSQTEMVMKDFEVYVFDKKEVAVAAQSPDFDYRNISMPKYSGLKVEEGFEKLAT